MREPWRQTVGRVLDARVALAVFIALVGAIGCNRSCSKRFDRGTLPVDPGDSCSGRSYCDCDTTSGCEVLSNGCLCACDYGCPSGCVCACGGGEYLGCRKKKP